MELAGGVPFVSDQDLVTALDQAGVPTAQADVIVDENESARIDGLRVSLFVLALIAAIALFFTRLLPTAAVGSPEQRDPQRE